MANNLGSPDEIKKDIEAIVEALKKANKEIIKIAKEASKLGQAFDSIKNPEKLTEETEKLTKAQKIANAKAKEYDSLQKKLLSTTAKLALVNSRENRAINLINKEKQILVRQQKNELIQVSELTTEYEKLSAETNNLRRDQKNLLTLQAKGNKLTTEQTKKLKELNKQVKENDEILKDVDKQSGQFFRNVGNYASTFDGLGNAINQLTREAPAFANSLQTGFLAISNNLPTLFDQIEALIEKNKLLQAEGKPTESVFSQLTKSLFSLQTALSLGVTLLTVYGKDLVKIIEAAIKGKAPIRSLAKEQKLYNEALKEGAKSASLEIAQMKLLFTFAQDTSKSYKDRGKAVDKLIKSSKGLITEQDRLNILNGKALEIENKLTKAILQKAIVSALTKKLSDDVNKLIENEIELQKIKELRLKTVSIEELKALKAQDKVLKGTTVNKRKAAALDQKAKELTEEKTRLEKNFNSILLRTSKLLNLKTL